ncbi:MAG: rod shape-determining protein MreC [Candidatus Neomarinimicrobiota bacterium]|nr:rod shape-determining protein MreC [Candidatus Neomarinimicrobiota bacterium]
MAKIDLLAQQRLNGFILFLCIFISFVLIFNNNNKNVQSLRTSTLDTFSFLYQPFNWLDNQLFLNKKLEVLSQENLKLNLENQILFSNKIENERLRNLLKFRDRNEFDFIGADILSKGMNSNMASVLLNRGLNDGVKNNDPVLSSRGVVGKIILVADDYSAVQLLSDIDFRLSVKIMPSETEGIMRWIANDTCEIVEVQTTSDVQIGDIVLTSNLSIYFPPNLPVGEVISFYKKSNSSNKVVRMKLFSDLSTLNQLFILRGDS